MWLGISACVLYVASFVAVARIWPGDALVIGIATTLQYVVPLAGLVVGIVARRREGHRVMSTTGLTLSTACLLAAVVPVVIDVFRLLF